jgi:hypothetical protein
MQQERSLARCAPLFDLHKRHAAGEIPRSLRSARDDDAHRVVSFAIFACTFFASGACGYTCKYSL